MPLEAGRAEPPVSVEREEGQACWDVEAARDALRDSREGEPVEIGLVEVSEVVPPVDDRREARGGRVEDEAGAAVAEMEDASLHGLLSR